jgi:Tle cognate immunity protein 4 C-terminal domain/Tle cognate immunity protein 4 N-terminal domain
MKLDKQSERERWAKRASSLLLIVCTSAALLITGCDKSQGKIPMNATVQQLTQGARSYCVGRFLVDLPAQVLEVNQQQRYSEVGKIETIHTISKEQFQQVIAKREQELKAQKHEKDPSLLLQAVNLQAPTDNRTLIYWQRESTSILKNIDTYSWINNQQFLFTERVGVDDVQAGLSDITKTLNHLQTRQPYDIPTQTGFCIDGGFIADTGYMHEEAQLSYRYKTHPDITVIIQTNGNGDKLRKESLLQREGGAMGALLQVFGAMKMQMIKTLRKGEKSINGLKGEELLMRIPTDDAKYNHNFQWEALGQVNSSKYPFMSITMSTGDTGPDKSKASSLTDEEAIALWDSLLNSWKIRPGAASK